MSFSRGKNRRTEGSVVVRAINSPDRMSRRRPSCPPSHLRPWRRKAAADTWMENRDANGRSGPRSNVGPSFSLWAWAFRVLTGKVLRLSLRLRQQMGRTQLGPILGLGPYDSPARLAGRPPIPAGNSSPKGSSPSMAPCLPCFCSEQQLQLWRPGG